MANIKSAKKRVKVSAKKYAINKSRKSEMKSTVKRVIVAVESNDKAAAKEALVKAISVIDTIAGKGTLHKNTASRKVARLSKLVDSME